MASIFMGGLLELLADLIFYWRIYGRIEVENATEREESAHNPPLFMGGSRYLWTDYYIYGQIKNFMGRWNIPKTPHYLLVLLL
jgi:hypothetical protein